MNAIECMLCSCCQYPLCYTGLFCDPDLARINVDDRASAGGIRAAVRYAEIVVADGRRIWRFAQDGIRTRDRTVLEQWVHALVQGKNGGFEGIRMACGGL